MLLGAASAELGFAFATLSRARRPARRRRPAERSPGAPAVPPTTEGTAPRVLQRCVRSHGLSNVRTRWRAGGPPHSRQDLEHACVARAGRPRSRPSSARRTPPAPRTRRAARRCGPRRPRARARRAPRARGTTRGCARRAIARRRRRRRGAPRRPGAPRRSRRLARNSGATPFNAAFTRTAASQNGSTSSASTCRRAGAQRGDRDQPAAGREVRDRPAARRARDGRARSARAPARPPTGTPRTASRPSPRARRRSRATAASARSPGEPTISGASGTAAGAVRSRTNSMTSSSVRTGHARDHAAWSCRQPGRASAAHLASPVGGSPSGTWCPGRRAGG